VSDKEEFYTRANRLLEYLEEIVQLSEPEFTPNIHLACQWQDKRYTRKLVPVEINNRIKLEDLKCIDRQKLEIIRNTRQFLKDLPANNVLLWGPRGTGKSSLIRTVFNEFSNTRLRLVEVEKDLVSDLPLIIHKLKSHPYHFIIFCDDLSFDANDSSYKALKVVLDGSIRATPDNILIYATSNRRHLLPEYMNDNVNSKMVNGELHLSEAIEEKISLSERFGMWISFHPFNQADYLKIVRYWLEKLQAPDCDPNLLEKAALKWALEHGSRSGRSAWLFARDWTGRQLLEND